MTIGSAAVAVGLGGAAIAGPGGGTTELVSTSELSSSGGVSVPTEGASDGAVEADVVQPAPAPVPADPAPVAPAPPAAPEAPALDGTAVAVETPPEVEAEASPAPDPVEQTTPSEERVAEEELIEEPAMPTRAEVLDEQQRPLVPVVILSAPVESASEGDPLIADGEDLAVAAQNGEGEDDGEAPPDDDGEIIIPVDPDDKAPEDPAEPPPGSDGEETLQPGPGTPRTIAVGDTLALTGLAVEGPLGVGLVLLLLGGLLRLTARPTAVPEPA